MTERGPRKTSLDYYLYKIALEEDVNFEFSHPLNSKNLEDITDNSIIAVGNYSPIIKYLKLPCILYRHYTTHMKIKNRNITCIAYFDSYLDKFGYISSKDMLLSAKCWLSFKQT